MSANRIRKKKPSTVRFNYVQGVTKSGTVKFNKVDVAVCLDSTSVARNEASPEVASNHLAMARSYDTFCHNDTDEAAPDVLDNVPDNWESTDSELENTIDENQNLSRFTRMKKKRVKAWETIRNQLCRAAVTSVVIPSGTQCKICGDNRANVYCKQRGLQAFFVSSAVICCIQVSTYFIHQLFKWYAI